MATRTINIVYNGADGEPWVGGKIRFELLTPFAYTGTEGVGPKLYEKVLGSSGDAAFTPWVPDDAEETARYRVVEPSGNHFEIEIGQGGDMTWVDVLAAKTATSGGFGQGIFSGQLIALGTLLLAALEDITGPALLGRLAGTGAPQAIELGTAEQFLRGDLSLSGITAADLLGLIPTAKKWTPDLSATTPGDFAVTYSRQVGYLCEIPLQPETPGDPNLLVLCGFWMIGTVNAWTSASGPAVINGLTRPAANSTIYGPGLGQLLTSAGLTGAGSPTELLVNSSSTAARLGFNTKVVFNSTGSTVQAAGFAPGASINLSGWCAYFAHS